MSQNHFIHTVDISGVDRRRGARVIVTGGLVEGVRLGVWNVRGWTKNKNDENYQFREHILRNTNIEILALIETFLKGEEKLCVDGYRFLGNNRQVQGQNARRGSMESQWGQNSNIATM